MNAPRFDLTSIQVANVMDMLAATRPRPTASVIAMRLGTVGLASGTA